MKSVSFHKILLLTMLLSAAALAQTAEPALSAGEVMTLLGKGSDDGLAYTATELAAILQPSASATTRGLKAGEGTAVPGTTGSGVLPDLQIHFATNSAKVSPKAQQQLEVLAQAIQFPALRNLRFEIAGHTDATGSAQANQLLSQRRAAAAVDLLTQVYAITPDRLQAVGYGEAHLAVPPTRPAVQIGGSRCGWNRLALTPQGHRFGLIRAEAITAITERGRLLLQGHEVRSFPRRPRADAARAALW